MQVKDCVGMLVLWDGKVTVVHRHTDGDYCIINNDLGWDLYIYPEMVERFPQYSKGYWVAYHTEVTPLQNEE